MEEYKGFRENSTSILERDIKPYRKFIEIWKDVSLKLILKDSRGNQVFFLTGFSLTDTDDSQDSRGREGTTFYSTLPLPPALKHSDIYLQLCMWDDCHIFLIKLLVFTRLQLHEIYHFIKLPFDSLMMWCLFLFFYLLIWF